MGSSVDPQLKPLSMELVRHNLDAVVGTGSRRWEFGLVNNDGACMIGTACICERKGEASSSRRTRVKQKERRKSDAASHKEQVNVRDL